ncbi:hypothetical protein [Flavobacterium sp. PS2]|uniref:hypothetical protein n=1 Tax=Flavobacterium sp. PS2 TaxID=3384157 RepID=UPI00390C7E6A
MIKLKIKNSKIKWTTFFLLLLISCQNNKNTILSFRENNTYLCYNVYKKTDLPPTTRHTYVFRNNGDFYQFEYQKNTKEETRICENTGFFKPLLWKIKGDSILINNLYYNPISKVKGEIILSKKNHDTLVLKEIKNKFDIEFFKRKDSYIYTKNKKGDTIEKKLLLNL